MQSYSETWSYKALSLRHPSSIYVYKPLRASLELNQLASVLVLFFTERIFFSPQATGMAFMLYQRL